VWVHDFRVYGCYQIPAQKICGHASAEFEQHRGRADKLAHSLGKFVVGFWFLVQLNAAEEFRIDSYLKHNKRGLRLKF